MARQITGHEIAARDNLVRCVMKDGGAGGLERARLRRDFPINREYAGKFRVFLPGPVNAPQFLQCFQSLRNEFLKQSTGISLRGCREFSHRVREIILAGAVNAAMAESRNPQLPWSASRCPLLDHLRRVVEAAEWNVN